MFYELLKPFTKIYYSVYYKFGYNTLKHVTSNTPLVIAPNHCNGFIDPVVIACNAEPKVRFFARGDVFKGKFVKWMLNDMNISPMYRMSEGGLAAVKKNDRSFEECRKLLSEKKSVLLFPEAICVPEKRLQPLKKGLARIVFQTEEVFDFEKKVVVLPVGIHYSEARRFRSDLFLNFGQPILLKNYKTLYEENKVIAINQFTRDLQAAMQKVVIHINNKHNDELVEVVFEIYLHDWMKKKKREVENIEKRFESRREMVEMINHQDEVDPDAIKNLKEMVVPYLEELEKHQLRDHVLNPETIEKSGIGKFFSEFFVLWFGLPLYALGIIIHGLPLYIAKKFADKNIKKTEFYASIRVNMGMLFWMINFVLEVVLIGFVFRSWIVLGVFVLLAFLTGKFALFYYSFYKKVMGRWRLLRLVRKDREVVEGLVTMRSAIVAELDEMRESDQVKSGELHKH